MKNLKDIPDFNEGVQNTKQALECINQAKQQFLKAREIAANELKAKKEEIRKALKIAKKKKSDLEEEMKSECKKIGHCYKIISKKSVTHHLRHPYEFGHLYRIEAQCKCCGEKTLYKSVGADKEKDLSVEHKELIEKYTREIEKVDLEIKSLNNDLKQINEKLYDICKIFGHVRGEIELKRDKNSAYSYLVIKCDCCGKEIEENDFKNCESIFTNSILSDLIRFSKY